MRGVQRYQRETVRLEDAIDAIVSLFLDGCKRD
jgi:hypothetical protein